MGPSWPVEETITLDSITLGSMHIWVSWFRLTRVQLVTAPATRLLPLSSAFTIRSSTAVALKSLMLGACNYQSTASGMQMLSAHCSVLQSIANRGGA